MEPKWPSPLRRQRLIDYSQTRRPDGYDYTMIQGTEYENGVETVWTMTGKMYERRWGFEEILDFRAEGMPPQVSLEEFPIRTERRFSQGKKRRDGFEATIEYKDTFADGRVRVEKMNVLFKDTLQELLKAPNDEYIEKLRGALERGEALDSLGGTGKEILR